jgi:hypothetical protein
MALPEAALDSSPGNQGSPGRNQHGRDAKIHYVSVCRGVNRIVVLFCKYGTSGLIVTPVCQYERVNEDRKPDPPSFQFCARLLANCSDEESVLE